MEQIRIASFFGQKEILKDLRNYLAGRAEGLSRDESLLEEVLKCTFAYHYMHIKNDLPHKDELESPTKLALKYRVAFTQVCEQSPDLFPKESQILLGPENINYIHSSLEKIRNLKKNDDDLIGDIYEIFIGTSYRGQEGQYFTPVTAIKALVEITVPSANDLLIDPACGAGGFLVESCKYIGKELDPQKIHGIDKDDYLARLTKLRMTLQFDANFHIQAADSLAWDGDGFSKSPTARNFGRYDLCLTNPPFGRKIIALSDNDKHKFELAHKWKYSKKFNKFSMMADLAKNAPPQVLFIERCISLLKNGGRLGIVVPESVISNTGHRHVVNYILTHTTPIAILGMPEALFKTSGKGGTHTKVCLVVLKKGKPKKNHKVFMAEAKWCGHDSRGKKIPYNDMPRIVEKFLSFQETGETNGDRFGFQIKLEEIKNLILAPRYYNPELAQELAKLRKTHHLVKIEDLIKEGVLSVSTGDELGKLAYGTGDIPFVRTSDISNWEIKADPKHLVDESYYEEYGPKQDVRAGDILMVRDGTYLIGTCAMVTKYDTKILYQSHIFKIRVNPNDLLDNYLLLAILSSKPVQSQVRTMSFTLDIIDSLGDRLGDIMLPIPKDKRTRKKISKIVEKSIMERIEARELARQARELVTTSQASS
ncbi:MAG: N-6 DNA methylase [Deltaproteobacteria bacterium]|nr:N-6 DNA methylase [Deltaproteobacteria bacterium]